MKFVDLFAGLGGFHVALSQNGHQCVFASEIDKELSSLYEKNFKIKPAGDIRKIDISKIPNHDILCAGFPCQPFSKAGKRKGFNDEENGQLFFHLLKIISKKRPTYFILENVPHFQTAAFSKIEKTILDLGYKIHSLLLSPEDFGIPQNRMRYFLLGTTKNINLAESFATFPVTKAKTVQEFIKHTSFKNTDINGEKRDVLLLYERIFSSLPETSPVPVPLWLPEFDANYPLTAENYSNKNNSLLNTKGLFGQKIFYKNNELMNLPRYVKMNCKLPDWKIRFIQKSRLFLKENREFFKPYIDQISKYPFSWQKVELNYNKTNFKLKDHIIQFRPSGIRFRSSRVCPSLISFSPTQIPIYGWNLNSMQVNDALKLQGFNKLSLPESRTLAFRALGNAVNVKVISWLTRKLIYNEFEDRNEIVI